MEFIARSNNVRISPRKVRLVADAIRKMSAIEALNRLSLVEKRAGEAIEKTLKSAVANAKSLSKTTGEKLRIKSIEIFEGTSLKRFHPSTRGRTHPYKKRGSHIKIVLEEKGAHGTKS